MKTLSINPFNLRKMKRNCSRKSESMAIPAKLSKGLRDNFAAMQGPLDYMATNYGIRFSFISVPCHLPPIFGDEEKDFTVDFVSCWKNNKKAFSDVICTGCDDDADVARNIYMAASEMLEPEKQESDNKLYGVTTQGITQILKPTLKIYSGILEYYAKKYDGMEFTVDGVNGNNCVVDINPPHLVITCKYNSKEADTIIGKVDNEGHSSEANAFYTERGYNLHDFWIDNSYEKIHQIVKDVLKGEN